MTTIASDEVAGRSVIGVTVLLLLAATGTTIRMEARFDPGNARDHRGTRVDFAGDGAREWREAFPATLRAYLSR